MKVLIDIPEKTYSYITRELKDLENDNDSIIIHLVRGVVNGAVIPDNVVVLDKEVADSMFGPAFYNYGDDTEKRLIDATKLKNAIESLTWYHIYNGKLIEGSSSDLDSLYKADDIYKAIDNAHTIRAERPTGKWIKEKPFLFRCSICGRTLKDIFEDDLSDYPYCHCGAKMKENNR